MERKIEKETAFSNSNSSLSKDRSKEENELLATNKKKSKINDEGKKESTSKTNDNVILDNSKNNNNPVIEIKKNKFMRKIIINKEQEVEYISNSITTAKYNIFTFFPLTIILQFASYFNIFFLITACILSIPQISPLNPITSIGPLIFVITVGMIREGYEDYKRHNYDQTYNNSLSLVYNNFTKTFCVEKWKDIKVGSIVKILKNETVPADFLVIKSSEANGYCYLQTTNLDGETALKPKESLLSFSKRIVTDKNKVKRAIKDNNNNSDSINSNNDIVNMRINSNDSNKDNISSKNANNKIDTIDFSVINGYLEVDPPDNNIYKAEGRVEFLGDDRDNFDINNIILRGGTLKNVDYIYGIVIYSGKDTKLMQNIQNYSLKRSGIEIKLNRIVIIVMLIVFTICIICTVLGLIFRSNHQPNYKKKELNSEYIYYGEEEFNTLELFKTFTAFFAIFNTMIPISIMIMLEIAKGLQVFLLYLDKKFKEHKDDKLKILSLKLQEDLGNVRYIFTDKTGTLTRNEMEFKACSIFNYLYDNKIDSKEDYDDIENNIEQNLDYNTNQQNENEENNIDSNEILNINNNDLISSSRNQFNKEEIKNNNIIYNNTNVNKGKSINKSTNFKSCFSRDFNHNILKQSLYDSTELKFLTDNKVNNIHKPPPYITISDVSQEFFFSIALNHNVLSEYSETEGKTYQGASPDECILVKAAQELGIEFIDRDGAKINLNYLDYNIQVDILYRFEYSSVRMRSSVIIRNSKNEIKLFIKGADSVILKRLDNYSKDYLLPESKEHLEQFAKQGLRTLCYGVKTLSEEEFKVWEKHYNELKFESIKNKELVPEVEDFISGLEMGITLLGVTALEDKLQDKVTECLNAFIESGIEVFMLTGDKLDTAESIGYSCKMFKEDTEVYKIKADIEPHEVSIKLKEILSEMDKTEAELKKMKIDHKKKKKGKNKKEFKRNTINNVMKEKKNFSKMFYKPSIANIVISDNCNSNKMLFEKHDNDSNNNKNIKVNTYYGQIHQKKNNISPCNFEDKNNLRATTNYFANKPLNRLQTNINSTNNDDKMTHSQFNNKIHGKKLSENLVNINKLNKINNHTFSNKFNSNNKANNPLYNSLKLPDRHNINKSQIPSSNINLNININNINTNQTPINLNNIKNDFLLNNINNSNNIISNMNTNNLFNNNNNNNDKNNKNNTINLSLKNNTKSSFIPISLANKTETNGLHQQSKKVSSSKELNTNTVKFFQEKLDLNNYNKIKVILKQKTSNFHYKRKTKTIVSHNNNNNNHFLPSVSNFSDDDKNEINDLSVLKELMAENIVPMMNGDNENEISIFNQMFLRYNDKSFASSNKNNNFHFNNRVVNKVNDEGVEANVGGNNYNYGENGNYENFSNRNVVNNGDQILVSKDHFGNHPNMNQYDQYYYNQENYNNNYNNMHFPNNLNHLNINVLGEQEDYYDQNNQLVLQGRGIENTYGIQDNRNHILQRNENDFQNRYNIKPLNIDIINNSNQNQNPNNNLPSPNPSNNNIFYHNRVNNNYNSELNFLNNNSNKHNKELMIENQNYQNIPNYMQENMYINQDIYNNINNNNNNIIYNYPHNTNKQTEINTVIDFYRSKIESMQKRKKNFLGFNLKYEQEEEDIIIESDITNFGLLIEGNAISLCLENQNQDLFWKIIQKSRSVVCCRCSPIQKSSIVKFIKNKSNKVCVGIGDGGNDVNMIKTANIGVGIFGKEGSQAAYNSDYAFSQFKYLKRLILVHGRHFILRNSYFVYYFFYKNIIFTFPQFWFAFLNGFSGKLLWDDWYILAYNSFITCLPVGMRMLFEEDIDVDFKDYPSKEKQLEFLPRIYKETRNSKPFTILKFFKIFLVAILHSVLIYFIPFICYNNNLNIFISSGDASDLWHHSFISFMAVLVIQILVIYEDINYYNVNMIFWYSFQLIFNIFFFITHNYIFHYQLANRIWESLGTFLFWATIVLTTTIAYIPVFVHRRAKSIFSNGTIVNLKNKKMEFDLKVKLYEKKLDNFIKLVRGLLRFKKVQKLLIDNIEPDTMADKKMKDIVEKIIRKRKKVNKKTSRKVSGLNNNKNNNEGYLDDEGNNKPNEKNNIMFNRLIDNNKNDDRNIENIDNILLLNDLNLNKDLTTKKIIELISNNRDELTNLNIEGIDKLDENERKELTKKALMNINNKLNLNLGDETEMKNLSKNSLKFDSDNSSNSDDDEDIKVKRSLQGNIQYNKRKKLVDDKIKDKDCKNNNNIKDSTNARYLNINYSRGRSGDINYNNNNNYHINKYRSYSKPVNKKHNTDEFHNNNPNFNNDYYLNIDNFSKSGNHGGIPENYSSMINFTDDRKNKNAQNIKNVNRYSSVDNRVYASHNNNIRNNLLNNNNNNNYTIKVVKNKGSFNSNNNDNNNLQILKNNSKASLNQNKEKSFYSNNSHSNSNQNNNCSKNNKNNNYNLNYLNNNNNIENLYKKSSHQSKSSNNSNNNNKNIISNNNHISEFEKLHNLSQNLNDSISLSRIENIDQIQSPYKKASSIINEINPNIKIIPKNEKYANNETIIEESLMLDKHDTTKRMSSTLDLNNQYTYNGNNDNVILNEIPQDVIDNLEVEDSKDDSNEIEFNNNDNINNISSIPRHRKINSKNHSNNVNNNGEIIYESSGVSSYNKSNNICNNVKYVENEKD